MRKSPLKWAGGKSRLLKHILPRLGPGSRLIEPMAGSAVVSLNAEGFESYMIGDSNSDLISFYRILTWYTEQVIEEAAKYFQPRFNDALEYNQIRFIFNSFEVVLNTKERIDQAAQFLYLNRHGYNGLCRYSRKGGFNVPFGKYSKPYFPGKELAEFARWTLDNDVKFFCGDVIDALSFTKPGDWVYLDPPYVPLSATSSFTTYDGTAFDWNAQMRLAEAVRMAAERGAVVLVSNHDTEATRALYASAEVICYNAKRSISCDGKNRKSVGELLAIFGRENA